MYKARIRSAYHSSDTFCLFVSAFSGILARGKNETDVTSRDSPTLASEDMDVVVPPSQQLDTAPAVITHELTCDAIDIEPNNDTSTRTEATVDMPVSNATEGGSMLSTKTFYGCRKRKPTRPYSPPDKKHRK